MLQYAHQREDAGPEHRGNLRMVYWEYTTVLPCREQRFSF